MKYIKFLFQLLFQNDENGGHYSEMNNQYKDQGLQFDEYGNPIYLNEEFHQKVHSLK